MIKRIKLARHSSSTSGKLRKAVACVMETLEDRQLLSDPSDTLPGYHVQPIWMTSDYTSPFGNFAPDSANSVDPIRYADGMPIISAEDLNKSTK